ncbi:uncharacterized protein [Antedon mediterranea]|uniref:uncharacterized protein n=1 Tax=Antedon mediterranea TaxID=105859 RepID=UPI003AF8B8D3
MDFLTELTYEISGDTYPEAVDGGSILEYTCLLVYKVEPEHTAINISFEVDLPFSSFHEDSFNVTLYSEALGILPHQTIDENVDDEKSKAAVKILHLFHDPIVQKVYVKVDISESMWVNLTEPWKRPDCWWVPAFPDCYQTLYSECVFYDKSPEQTWDPAYCYQFKVSDCLPFNTTTECYYINTTSCLMALIADAERPQDMLCPTDVNETDCIQINDRGLFFTQYDFSVPTVAPIPETYEKDFCGMSMESIWMTEETAYERQYTYDSTIEEDENGCVRVLMRIKPIITTPPPTYNPYKALRKTEKYINAKTCMNANTTGFYTQPIQPINWKDFNITILFTGEIFNYVEVNQVLVSEVYVNITQSTKLINQIRRVFAIQKIPIKRPGYWVYNNPTFSDRNFTLKHEQILHHGVLIHPEAFNRGFTMTIDVPKVDDVYLAKFENITPWWKTGKHFAAISDYHMFNSTYNTNGDELTLETVIDKMEGYYDGDSRLPDITSEWVVEQNDYGEEIIVQCIFSVTPFLNIKDVVWRDHGRLNFYLYSRVLSSVVADNELKFSITADFKFPPGDELILYASRTSTVTVQPFVPRIPPVNATQEPDCQDDITYTFELFNILEFSIKDIWMNVTCPDLVIIPSTLEVEIIHHVNVTSDSNADIMLTTDQTYHIHYTELAPQVLARGQQTFRLVNNGIAPHYSIVCKVYLSFRKDNKALVLPYLAGVSNELFTPGIEYILYGRDLIEKEEETTPLMYSMPVGSNATFIINITVPEITTEVSDNIVLEFNVVLLDEKETVVKDTEHEFKTTVIYTNGQDLVQQQSVAVLEPDIQVYLRVANESTNADPGEIFQYYIKVNHTSVSQSPAHHINVTIHLPYMIINKHFLPYEYSRVPVRGKKFEPGFEYENDEILLLYLYKLDLDEVIEGTFLVQITTKLMEGICLQAQVKYEMSSFYQWGRYYPYTTVSENVLNIRNATLKFIGTSLHDTPDKLVAIHEQVTYRITIPLPPISSNLTIEIFLPTRNVTRKIWEVLQIQEEIPEVLPIEETFFDNGCYTVMRPCFCYGAGNMSFDASWFISRFTCKLKTDQMCTNSTDLDTGESNITNCDYSPDVYSKCRNLSKEMCFQNENVTTYLQTPISHFQQMACNMSNSTMNNNDHQNLTEDEGFYPIPDFCFEETIIELGMAKVVNTSIVTTREGVICTFTGGNNHNPHQPGVKYKAMNLPGFGLGGDSVSVYVTMVISDEVENVRDETLFINASSTFMYLNIPIPPPLRYEENCTCSKPLTHYFDVDYPLDCGCESMYLVGHKRDLCNCTTTFHEIEESYFSAPSCDCVNFCENNVQYFFNQPMVKNLADFDNATCDCGSYKDFSNSQNNFDYLSECREMYFRNYTCQNVNHTVKKTVEECRNITSKNCLEVNELQDINVAWLCQCSSDGLNCSCEFDSFPLSPNFANYSIVECQNMPWVKTNDGYNGDISLCDCHITNGSPAKSCHCSGVCSIHITNSCTAYNHTFCEDVTHLREYLVNDGLCICEKFYGSNHTIQDALRLYKYHNNTKIILKNQTMNGIEDSQFKNGTFLNVTMSNSTATNANETTQVLYKDQLSLDDFVLYCNCSDVDIIIPDIKPVQCKEIAPKEVFVCQCFVPADNETQLILDNWDYNLTIVDEAVTYLGDEFVVIEPELEISFVRIEPNPVDIVDSLDFVKFGYKIQHTDSSNSPAYNLTLFLDAVNFTITNGSGKVLPTDILSSRSCSDETLCEISYDNEVGHFHLGFLPVDVDGASFEGTFSLALRDDVDFVANSIISGTGILWYDSCVVDFPGRLYGPINSSDICHIYAPNITAKLEFTTAYAYMYQNEEYGIPNTFSIGDYVDIRAHLWVPEITLNVANYSISGDNMFSFTPVMAVMLLTDRIYVRNDTATFFLDQRHNPHDNEFHILYPDEQYDTAEFTDKGIAFIPGVLVNQADNIASPEDYLLLKFIFTLKDDPLWKQDDIIPFTVSVVYYSDYDGQLLTLIDKNVELKVVEPRLTLRVEILDYKWQVEQVQNTTGYTCVENTCCEDGEPCDTGRVCVTDSSDMDNCETHRCLCYSGFALNAESTCTAVGRTAGDILVFGLTVFHSQEYTGNAFDLYITLYSDLKSDLLPDTDTMGHIPTDGYLGNVRKPRLTQISDHEFQLYVHRFDHVVSCERFTVPFRIKPSLHVFAGQTWEVEATMNYRSSKPYDTPFNIKSRLYDMKDMNDTIRFPLFAPAPSVRFKMLPSSGQSSPINFEVFSSSMAQNEVMVNVREEDKIVFQAEVVIPKIKCSMTFKLNLPEGSGITLENVTMVSMGTAIDFPETNFGEPQVTESIDGQKFFFAYFPDIHSKANTLNTPRSLDSTKQQMFKSMNGEQQPYPTNPECNALNSSLYEQTILLGCYHNKMSYFGGFITDMHPSLPFYNLSQVMTRQLCLDHCSDRRYDYAGLLKGAICLCGTEEQFMQYYQNRTFELNGTLHHATLDHCSTLCTVHSVQFDATLDHCSTLCTGENASCGSMEFALLYGPIPGSVPKQQCDWYSGLYDETEDVFVVEFSLSIHSLATKGIEEYLHLQVTYDHGENKTSTLLPLAPYKIETGIVKLLMNVYVSPKMSGYVPGDYLEYYTEVRHAAHSTVTARDVYILWMLPSYIEYVNVTNHPSLPFTYRHIEDVENVETDPRVGIKFYVKTLFHDDVIGFHFMVRLDPLHTLPQGEYHLMSMTQVYYDSWGIHNHFEEDYTFDVVPHAHPVVPIKITFEVPSKYSGREQLDDIKLSTYNVLYDEINNIVYACFFNNTINVYKGGCFMTGDLPSYLTETPHTCEDYCNCTYLENHLTFDNCSNYEPRPSNCTCGCVPDCIEDMMSCEIDCLNNTFSNADLSSCLAGCKRVQVNCTQGCCIDTCDKDLDLCLLNNCVECNYFANCSVELKCAEQCISKNDGCSQTCIRSPVTCHENCSSASWDCLLNCNQLCGESTNTNCKEYCYSDCLADENRCLSDCCYTDCNVNATLCTQQCSTDCRLDGNCIISCLSNCNSTGFTCNETCAAQVYDCQDNCNQNCSVTSCTVIIETDCAEEEVNDLVENILTNYSLTNLHNNGIIGLEKASLMLTSVNCSGNSCTTEFQVTNTSSSCSATATEYCQTDLDSSCAINCVGLCEATSSCIGEYLNCLDTCGSDPTGTCDVVLLRNVSIDFCLIDALNCILMMSNCYLSCNSSESCLKCDDVYCASNYTQCVEIVTMDNRTYSADNVLHQTLNLTDGNSCLSECNRNLTKCQQVCRQHNNVSYICHSTCLRGHYGCASQCLTYINEQSICGIADSTTNTNETNLIHNSECNRQCEDDLVICKQLFSHIMNRTVNNITTEHYSIAVNCSSYKECGDICSNLCANTPSCSMFSCQAQCVQDATHGVCHSEVNCTILKMCVEHSRRRRRDADLFPADVTFGSSYTTSRRLNQEPLNHTLLVESRKRREAFIAKENSFKTVSSESDLGNVWSNTFDMRHNIQRIRRSLHDADMNNTYLNISIQDGGGFVESQCTTRNQHLEYIKCLDTCLVYPNVSTNNVSGGDVMNNASLQNTSSSIGCDNCQNIQPSSHARCYTLCNQTDAFCSANCSSNCTTSNNCSCSEFCNRPLAECLAICDKTSLNSCNWCRSLSCEEDSFCLCDRVCVNMTFIEVNNSKCVSESYCTILQEMCFYDCECKLPQYIFRHWRGLDSNVGNLLGLLPEPYTLYGLAHDGRAIMQSFDFGATWAAILKSVWLEAKDKEQYIEATNLEEILNLEPNLVFQSEFQNDTFGVSGVGIHFLKTVYEWKVDGTWNCCK